MRFALLLTCLVCAGASDSVTYSSNTYETGSSYGDIISSSYGEGSSYGPTTPNPTNSTPPSSPTKAPTAAVVEPRKTAKGTLLEGFDKIAPPKETRDEMLNNQPAPKYTPPAPPPAPVVKKGEKVVTEDVVFDLVSSTMPKGAIPVSCDKFTATTDAGKAIKQAVEEGIAEGAGVKDLSKVSAKCTQVSARRRRGRSLAEGDDAEYSFNLIVPKGDGKDVKKYVEASGENGVLLNSIKDKALKSGVATQELLAANPVVTLTVKDPVDITIPVERVVDESYNKAPTPEPTDGDLADGEIAAIVICVIIFFAGVCVGIWFSFSGGESPGEPDTPDYGGGDKPSQPNYSGGNAIPNGEAEYQLEQSSEAPSGYNV